MSLQNVTKMSQKHSDVCSDLSSYLTINFLSKIITGDETWYFQYDPKNKHKVSNGNSKQSHDPRKLIY